MKNINPLTTATLALSGLLTAGLLALPVAAVASSAGDAKYVKRDDDGSELVLVASDDDGDDDDDAGMQGQTRTRTGAQGAGTRTQTRTGVNSGRDHSMGNARADWTQDGPGARKRDWSANHTNDRSRHNTRGRR